MASLYELKVKVASASGLKNVNRRHGPNRPYAVVWVDPKNKCSARVDDDGDTEANWDQTLLIPLPPEPLQNLTLFMDVVHAAAEHEDTKPFIGSARLSLLDVGIGECATHALTLKRSSGRPQGKVDVSVTVKEPAYRAQGGYYPPPYGVPPPQQQDSYSYYNEHSETVSCGQGSCYKEEKKSKFGMGTGLAVGAVAGVLGGIALVEGVEYVEEKIVDDVAEKVEENLGYDGGDDDF